MLISNNPSWHKTIGPDSVHIVSFIQHIPIPSIAPEDWHIVILVPNIPLNTKETVHTLMNMMARARNVHNQGPLGFGMTDNNVVNAPTTNHSVRKRLKRIIRGLEEDILHANQIPPITQRFLQSAAFRGRWNDTTASSYWNPSTRRISGPKEQSTLSRQTGPTCGCMQLPIQGRASYS